MINKLITTYLLSVSLQALFVIARRFLTRLPFIITSRSLWHHPPLIIATHLGGVATQGGVIIPFALRMVVIPKCGIDVFNWIAASDLKVFLEVTRVGNLDYHS